MMLLGAGFGLGVALTLSRLVAGLASRLTPPLAIAGAVACVLVGLGVTFLVVNIRGLLRDRALLDRWTGDVTGSLRSVVEELVATRVLVAETVLSTALAAKLLALSDGWTSASVVLPMAALTTSVEVARTSSVPAAATLESFM